MPVMISSESAIVVSPKIVGLNIRACRQRLKLSQEYVAERMGYSINYQCCLEAGDKMPSVERLCQLSFILHAPVQELLKDCSIQCLIEETGKNDTALEERQASASLLKQCSPETVHTIYTILRALFKDEGKRKMI